MESSKSGASLKIEDFSFTYPQAENPALENITFSVPSGAFVVLCGPSGCGKTTLLRQCKPALAAHGVKSGAILFDGQSLSDLSARHAAEKIGFVQQNPDNQIVTDKVWHELAFGLENLGYDTPSIRLRVAEMASFFGIQDWFYRSVHTLSGGQKQLLTLACAMAMQPALLILDEPTSQLDPIAAAEFLAAVGKINRELGVTVLLTEQRLEEALPLCSHAVVMEKGRILCEGQPAQIGEALKISGHGMFAAMPAPMRIWAGVKNDFSCPVTVQEGRRWIEQLEVRAPIPAEAEVSVRQAPAAELEEVWFKYEQDSPDVIKGLSFAVYPGELTAILGGNGTGKTTMLSLFAGLNRPYRGKVKIKGVSIEKIPADKRFDHLLGVLPQNPQALFTEKTAERDLAEILSASGLTKAQRHERILKIAQLCCLTDLLQAHPYDLSGGEQQRLALAKVLLLEPQILFLDEPTKGLDAVFKQVLAGILHQLTAAGVAVIMVSHDIEFCAEYATRCALFFDGAIVSEGTPRQFFGGNSFYTSAANRMARHILPEAVTAGDVIAALGGNSPASSKPPQETGDTRQSTAALNQPEQNKPYMPLKKLSVTRKIVAGVSALLFLATAVYVGFHIFDFKNLIVDAGQPAPAANAPTAVRQYIGSIAAVALEAVVFISALCYKREKEPPSSQINNTNRKLSKRTVVSAVLVLLAIPLTIYLGTYFFGDRKYYFISLLIILEAMIPFALIFEGRKPQARELVILAVLTAIAVAGRAAFFMLPQFKPVAAIVIIAGVAFGGEAGFLVGALVGFVSNMLFGQGLWTPWQMAAFGLIGFLAGVLFKKGALPRGRISLCLFGGVSVFLIYGGLMNSSTVLMYQSHPTGAMLMAAYLQGVAFDLVHALATVIFLLLFAQPMLEKLDRVKTKYGLVEMR